MRIQVSENKRFLVHMDGTPFFYMGDTAWELFHRLTREDAELYLRNRVAKQFTVIQAVVLAEHEFERPNPYGALPLENNDPTTPNESYFEHVDWIVNRAEELGLHVGMLPTWGDKWNKKWGRGPELFTPHNAEIFGAFLGRRYRDKPIIWILGGDRPLETTTHRTIIEGFARGLRTGDGGRHLITFHPRGQETSSMYFHNAAWLDFNMSQTGHTRNRDSYSSIADDYAKAPVKPCMDGEPGYEDHPNGFKPDAGYLDDYDVRKAAYYALFAGAHGHTYGCHDVWQFFQDGWAPITSPRTPWKQAMDLPGASQMQWVRTLVESRPFLTRIPDQSLLRSDAGGGSDRVQATRDAHGRYAFIYSAAGRSFAVDMTKISGTRAAATWFDPRTGASHAAGEVQTTGVQTFQPPTDALCPDWVLILDDASQRYPVPGRHVD